MLPTRPYTPRAQHLDPSLYCEANRITFITVCAKDRRAPFVRADLNRTILGCLKAEQSLSGCLVFTYCLMPDHLHFLASPMKDGRSVLTFTDRFKGRTTRASWPLGWHGKLWQRGYYDHIVRTDESLRDIAAYILNNPIRKGLVTCAEAWPWGGQMNAWPGP